MTGFLALGLFLIWIGGAVTGYIMGYQAGLRYADILAKHYQKVRVQELRPKEDHDA